MKVITVKDLQDFLSHGLWDTENMLFRGVSRESYDLRPTVGRLQAQTEAIRSNVERMMLDDFKRRALPYLDRIPTNDFDWLYLARHYGLPTRLLDWTTNPLVAVFFASLPDAGDFAVYRRVQTSWLLPTDPKWDPLQMEFEEGWDVVSFGLRPAHADRRFINQSGVFTLQMTPTIPLDDDDMIKFVFPSKQRERCAWLVRKYGMSNSFIYASLDGVAADVYASHRRNLGKGEFDSTTPLFHPEADG